MRPAILSHSATKMTHQVLNKSRIQVRDEDQVIPHHTGMVRFNFDLHECGRILIDSEGVEMPDANAARANAVHEAHQIWRTKLHTAGFALPVTLKCRMRSEIR
jgi:hypothetical protein